MIFFCFFFQCLMILFFVVFFPCFLLGTFSEREIEIEIEISNYTE